MAIDGFVLAVMSLIAATVVCWLIVDRLRDQNRALLLELHRHVEKVSAVSDGDARYRLLFENAPMGCVVWEPGFTIVEWNRQAEEIFGWTRDQMIGRNFLTALVPSFARNIVTQSALGTLTDVANERMTLPHVTQDGRNITCEWSHLVMRDQDTDVVRVISLCLNVTSEQGLKLENTLFRSIMDLTDDPSILIFDLTAGNAVIHASDSACRRLGRSREELMGKAPDFLCCEGDSPELEACRNILLEKRRKTFEVDYQPPGGASVPLEVTLNLIEHNGRSYVVCYLRDIADRKANEAKLRELQIKAAVREHERRYREVFENASDAFFVLDVMGDGEMVFDSVNRAAEEAFGMPGAVLRGLAVDRIISGEMGEGFGCGLIRNLFHYRACVASAQMTEYEDKLDLLPAQMEGSRVFHVQLIPVRAEGKVRRIIGIGRDITLRKKYEAELLERVKLEEQMTRYFNTAPGVFFVLRERDGRWIMPFVSPGMRALCGLEPDRVVEDAASFFELIHPEDFEHLQVAGRGHPRLFHQELRIRHRNGSERWIEVRASLHQESGSERVWYGFMHDITDRKALEQALAKREQQMSSVAESVPGFLFSIRVDTDGRVRFPYASSGVQTLFGVCPETIREDGWALRAFYHPDDLPQHLQLMEASLRSLTPFRNEIRIIHPQEGLRWIEIRSTPNLQPDGATEWHGLMIDVTERKQEQQRMELLDRAFNQSTDIVMLLDESLHFVKVNDVCCNTLGYAHGELAHLTPLDLVPGMTPEACLKTFEKASRREKVLIRSAMQCKDGTCIPVDVHLDAVKHLGEQFYLAVVRDVSEQRRLEAQLSRRERDFRSLAENAPDLILRYDRQGRYVYLNPRAEAYLGLRTEEVSGKAIQDVFPDGRYELLRQKLQTAMEGGTRIEVEVMPGDGTVHQISINPEYGDDGIVCGAIVIGRDFTAYRDMERELIRRSLYQRTLIDNFPFFVWLKDENSKLLAANREYARVAQVATPDDLVGKSDFDFFPADLANKYVTDDRAVMASGKPKYVEEMYVDEHGRRLWMETWKAPVFVDGRTVGTVGFSRDISDRMQAMEARLAEQLD